MKTLEELEKMLVSELKKFCKHKEAIVDSEYLNENLGDTSILLTSILEEKLLATEEWNSEKWLDDSLLAKLKIDRNKVSVWGIVIFGKPDTTEQWTEPFYFEIKMIDDCWTDFVEMTFLFEDERMPEIIYEEFNQNRGVWDKGYYSDANWHPSERSWKYIINSKNPLRSTLA